MVKIHFICYGGETWNWEYIWFLVLWWFYSWVAFRKWTSTSGVKFLYLGCYSECCQGLTGYPGIWNFDAYSLGICGSDYILVFIWIIKFNEEATLLLSFLRHMLCDLYSFLTISSCLIYWLLFPLLGLKMK